MPDFYRHDNNQVEGIALAHTVYGAPLHEAGRARPDSHGSDIGPALWSTAPYRPPARRDKDNPDLALCSHEGCKAYPSRGLDYCMGHARQMGLVESCYEPNCKAHPLKGEKFCRWHLKSGDDGDAQ